MNPKNLGDIPLADMDAGDGSWLQMFMSAPSFSPSTPNIQDQQAKIVSRST